MSEQLRLQAMQDMVRALTNLQLTLTNNLPSVLSVRVSLFSQLPGSPFQGMIAGVSDSTTNTWGATITGGGSFQVLAYYDGAAWTVAAK